MDRATRNFYGRLLARPKKPYFAKVKNVSSGIATLDNGVKVEILKGQQHKSGDLVTVIEGEVNPRLI